MFVKSVVIGKLKGERLLHKPVLSETINVCEINYH